VGTSAVGIRNPAELAEIAQDVPSEVRESHCRTCLWSGVECQSGSLYDARPADSGRKVVCAAWAFYD
jgi:hypothetical protein